MTIKKEIDEILEEWIENHIRNLRVIHGWDENDFLDYMKQVIEEGFLAGQQSEKEKTIKEVEEIIKNCCKPITDYDANSLKEFREIMVKELLQKIKEKKS